MKKLLLFIALITGGSASAQFASWDFTAEDQPVTTAAVLSHPNLDAIPVLSRGSLAAPSAGLNSFRTIGFLNDGISVANEDYFEFSLSAATGYNLSLSSIDAILRGSNTFFAAPGVSIQFAYSLDGTTFNLIGMPESLATNPQSITQIDLTGVTALQNVADNIDVTFRFYASGQTTTGSCGFYSSTAGEFGLNIGGSVNLATGCTPTTNIITATACDTYTFDGVARTASGSYSKTLVGANSVGCDSIVTLNLTINNSYTGNATKAICAGGSYTFGTQTLTAAGTYNATLQTSKGCDSIVTLTLTVNPLPTPTITAMANGVLAASNASTYQWLNCNTANSPISGETSMNYTPTLNGSYSVSVKDANGCTATSSCFSVNGLSLADKGSLASIQIYPNPTKDKVTVELNSEENGIISVYNALGKVVFKSVINSNLTIDLSSMQNGVYLIQVTTSKGNNIQRIVKN